jgi:hypothetical protein
MSLTERTIYLYDIETTIMLPMEYSTYDGIVKFYPWIAQIILEQERNDIEDAYNIMEEYVDV